MSTEQEYEQFSMLSLIMAVILTIVSCYTFAYPLMDYLGVSNSIINGFVQRCINKLASGSPVAFYFGIRTVTILFAAMFPLLSKRKILETKKSKYYYLCFVILYAAVFLFSADIANVAGNGVLGSTLFIGLTLLSFVGLIRYLTFYSIALKEKPLMDDPFNDEGEDFEQVKEVIGDGVYSIHIPAKYKGERVYWNVVNPFAGNMVIGNPGTGKSYVFINEFIRQSLLNGFTMCVYDYKRGELTDMLYRYLHLYKDKILQHPSFKGKAIPKFATLDFDDPRRSVRFNPFHPRYLEGPEDCKDVATVFMQNLNKVWIGKKGEFFPESAIQFFNCCVQLARFTTLESKKNRKTGVAEEGNCSTFPHVIALINSDRELLFNVLKNHPKTKLAFGAFADAMQDGAMEQLSGQTATVKIGLASFATPKLFWAMSSDEANVFVSDPENPAYLCLINNELRKEVYGPAISLILSQVVKKINSPGNLPSLLAVDELATVYIKDVELLIATARSNKVAVMLGFQDFSQLIQHYDKKIADVVINTVGNIMAGRVVRESAKAMQDMFGKIKQKRVSKNYSSQGGTSLNTSVQLDYVIPEAKVATMSQGQFVLKLSDTVQHPLPIKFAKGFADIDSLGNKRIEHPSNKNYSELERPIIKTKVFQDQNGEVSQASIDRKLQENYDRILAETEELLLQEHKRLQLG